MSESKELTDQTFWDDAWQRKKAGRVSKYHYLYGKNGIFLRTIRRRFKGLEGKKIVELGGANSRFLLALAKWCNADVTAVDFSPIGLRKTEEIFSRNDCAISLVLADFLTWKDGAEQFDMVVHWGVLEHFGNPRPVLAKCEELLRPGGAVIFSMPNMVAMGAYFWKKWAPGSWEKHVFLPDSLVEGACNECGLELVSTFHWGPPLLRICRWERNGLPQMAVTAAQAGLILLDMVLPIYQSGHRKLSMYRGFVARKPCVTSFGSNRSC